MPTYAGLRLQYCCQLDAAILVNAEHKRFADHTHVTIPFPVALSGHTDAPKSVSLTSIADYAKFGAAINNFPTHTEVGGVMKTHMPKTHQTLTAWQALKP